MPSSEAIDAAVIAKLVNDATLSALMTDGVFFDEAKQGAEKFVRVSIVEHTEQAVFGGRAYEDVLYRIEAIEKSTSGTNANTAAARIDALLAEQALTATGYTWMTTFRESRIRMTEVDDVDVSIRWQYRGGEYRVQMSLG